MMWKATSVPVRRDGASGIQSYARIAVRIEAAPYRNSSIPLAALLISL